MIELFRYFTVFLQLPEYSGRYSPDNSISGNITGYYRTCSNDGAITNCHALQDGGVCTDPCIFTDHDRLWDQVMSSGRIQNVVQRCQDGMVPDQCAFFYKDPALVLHGDAGIDIYAVLKDDVRQSRY